MFGSFFLAGFECATGYNMHGNWIDQVAATHHDLHVDEDYRCLEEVGIQAVREAIRWPLVDVRGRYDFSSVRPFLNASLKHDIDVIWDLFHYGYPDDVDLFSATFPQRFADYCHAAARFISSHVDGTCWFTPINEPSFFAWAAGEVGRFAPHCRNRGPELKLALARAAIFGINAIRAACPRARIVNVDPLCRVVPPRDRPELVGDAEHFNVGAVFESWDMLSGRLHPELGGSREHLDVVGINYYWTNQWEWGAECTPLRDDDERRLPLRDLVRGVWERYGGELLITETGHVGDMRPVWMREMANESEALLREGVPLRGVCLYPILGMPEWHAQDEWAHMGLWDPATDKRLCRQVFTPMLDELRRAQRLEIIHASRNRTGGEEAASAG